MGVLRVAIDTTESKFRIRLFGFSLYIAKVTRFVASMLADCSGDFTFATSKCFRDVLLKKCRCCARQT